MDTIMQVFNIKALDAIDMASDSTSDTIELQRVTCFAVQQVWSGFSGTASISIEGSNDNENFTAVDTYNVSGASGNRLVNIEKAGYAYLRIVFNQTGTTTGTLTARVNGKAI